MILRTIFVLTLGLLLAAPLLPSERTQTIALLYGLVGASFLGGSAIQKLSPSNPHTPSS